jgi:hypothetical protein
MYIYIYIYICVCVCVKLNPDCHRKCGIQREESFRQQIGLKLKDQIVKRNIWSTDETLTLRKIEQKYLESF